MSPRRSIRFALAVVVTLVAFVASACSKPEPPDEWQIQRVAPPDDTAEVEDELCTEVRTFATGTLDDRTELEPMLEELARLAALSGATEALSPLDRVGSVADDPELTTVGRRLATHDLLVAASRPVDDATWVACEVPLFTALYAGGGIADCHLELDIAVAAHMDPPDPSACGVGPFPDHLPCFSADEGYLPVDCVTGDVVAAAGDRWTEAGPPREIEIDRFDPEAVVDEGPPVYRPVESAACAALPRLFAGPDLPNGLSPDFDPLVIAVGELDPALQELVARFVTASTTAPDFAEFETLVAELDGRSAEACGLPIVSAWASLQSPVTEPLCWVETGFAYPAFARTECETTATAGEPG